MHFFLKQVKSEKLVCDIGLKTEVTIDDILEILKVWTRLEAPFMARYYLLVNHDVWILIILNQTRGNLFLCLFSSAIYFI